MPRKKKQTTKELGGVIVLENFQSGTIFKREVGPEDKYLHRLILSPTYLFKSVDGSVITDMGDNSYPLLAPLPRRNISLSTGDGKIACFLQPSISNDSRIVYVATNTGKVKALTSSAIARDLGQPLSLTNNYQTSLIIYTDKIFFINPTSTSIYHIPENTTGTSWTSVSGFNSPLLAETFSTYLYIADKNSAGDANRRLVRVLNTSYSVIGNLDLGTNWDVIDIVNNNNRFLIVFAQLSGISAVQYAFLWDGAYQNRYFHAIKLPGFYLGSINYMGAFLIFLQVGNSLHIYELTGYALRFLDIIPSIAVSTKLLPRQRFSVWGNYVFFPAKLKDLNLSGIIVYNPLEKEILFLYQGISNEIVGNILVSDTDNNLRIFYSDDTADTVKQCLFMPSQSLDAYINSTASPFQAVTDELIYVSNKINFIQPVRIDRIEVFYGTKPQNQNNIKLVIEGIHRRTGEEITTTKTIDVGSANFYSFFDDIGVVGNEITFKVLITTDGTFKGNLKRVLAYYSYLV